ncbi:hypothetical protein WM34_17765 [Burkholderia ubonensis]|uniref:AraC family transcriptional regulator n=2 Tax=Burkholderia ubonensis TaxID=101571 RepID=A0ABD4E415_9BURK|nr:hypothetical protein WJ51_27460 [Burkholderia ubonensis]KVM09850.1 hypothetical protein WJ52_24760 [Burkholderia ubonensis]KVM52966.1 hypothetical protein WJ56_08100 [Burkholderia ubonensis]KVN86470.1 hypothetical protein WJ68_10005 [Burkholderia ubonensis]KVO13968.1 hypothetical protein WJ72_15860 [Burkholderia ubonensis]
MEKTTMIDLAQCLLDVSARYLGLTIERWMVTAGADAGPARSARVGDPADGDFSLHAPPSRAGTIGHAVRQPEFM